MHVAREVAEYVAAEEVVGLVERQHETNTRGNEEKADRQKHSGFRNSAPELRVEAWKHDCSEHRDAHDQDACRKPCARPNAVGEVRNDAYGADEKNDELRHREARMRDGMARERWHVTIHHAHDRCGNPSEREGMHESEDGRLVEE